MTGKSVLVMTGSPRKNGNSDRLAAAFAQGALEAGHQVTFFETADKHIRGCVACDGCWSTGKPCVFDDDFDRLFPLMENADVILYATPLYWFTFPASLKAAVDKMYAYAGNRSPQPLKIRESLLMVCGGDEDPRIFEGITATYHAMVAYMNWNNRGVLIVPGVHHAGDVEKTNALMTARRYGEEL